MPENTLSPGVTQFYRDDDFTDPWTKPETVLMLHGNAESSEAWNSWIPYVARKYRVIRPDMRGFGRSTPMPVDYPWSIDGIIDDYIALMDHLGIEKFHLVGAKIGGGISLRFAGTRQSRLLSLTVLGARVIGAEALGGKGAEALQLIKDQGVEAWARESMGRRLGSDAPPEKVEGWIQMMGKTAKTTQVGFISNVPAINVSGDLANITAPTLMMVSQNSVQNSAADSKKWVAKIPHGELFVVPGDSYHVAASHPEICAPKMMEFVASYSAAAV